MTAVGDGDVGDVGIGRGDFVAKVGYLTCGYGSVIVGVKEEQRAAQICGVGDGRGLLEKICNVGDERL